MDKSDCIENLLSKPYWLIDVLPKQVPAGSAGQYFMAERYFLSWLDEISWKFARIHIRLNCYYDLKMSTDGESWILNADMSFGRCFTLKRLILPILSGMRVVSLYGTNAHRQALL